jgi:DNA-binding NarL/FixJ family response regulator
MIRILLADDHAILREGLRQLFAVATGVEVTGEAANGNQVLVAVKNDCFDLLLLDMTMPGISGIELIGRVADLQPKLPILVLSMHHDPQIVKRALQSGAAGYITKGSNPKQLLAAIRKVASGGRYIDPAVAEQIAFDVGNVEGAQIGQLSSREFEIFRLLAQGVGVMEIAAALNISDKTVSTHKARLMKKMGLKTTAELVRYALNNRLVD